MISNETNLLENASHSDDVGNSKRARIDSENSSILQLFVETSWEKLEIKKLAGWLISRGIDVDSPGWYYRWKRGSKKDVRVRTVGDVSDEDVFKDRITGELKNVLPLLFKCNDDINYTNKNGQTILHVYLANTESKYRSLHSSGRSKIFGIVKSLIKRGASVNVVDNCGNTPLHVAAETMKLEIVRLMLGFFSNIEACDERGNTLLHTVVCRNYGEDDLCLVDIAKTLLSKGANPNRRNREEMTPVQLAVGRCNVNLLPILEENGADFSVFTKNNENLLLLAYKNYYTRVGESAMLKITNFLVFHGCDVNVQNNDGYSPLHLAIKWNRSVERLIELGADVNCRTKAECQTPLHLAVAIRNHVSDKNFKALLRAGADRDAVDCKGRTPLDIAIENSNVRVVRLILEFGGDINEPNTSNLLTRCCKEIRRVAMGHAGKLRTIGLPINKECQVYLDRTGALWYNHERCLEEVNKLKTYMISDGVSLHKFLHLNFRQKLAHAERLPRDLESKFPVYANLILTARDDAVRRNQLLGLAKLFWKQINLPDVCVERILHFLSNWYLKMLIEATSTDFEN